MNQSASIKHTLGEGHDALLAKSLFRGHETLPGHTRHVLSAAVTLLNLVDLDVLKQLALDVDRWRERLHRAVIMGAWLHDAGKCNDHFQTMIRCLRTEPQSIRHEALSVILFTRVPRLRTWVCPPNSGDEIVFQAALCAAVGHHLKTDSLSASTSDETLIAYVAHPDFAEYLQLGAEHLSLDYAQFAPFSGPLELSLRSQTRASLPSLKQLQYATNSEALTWFADDDEDTRRWLAAVKSLVVAADIAGSALPVKGESIEQWITKNINQTLSVETIRKIVSELLGGKSNHEREVFQQEVANSTDTVTYVRAGCGAGKTLAAYKWAASRAAGRKLFFCYPTTGTASQGFKDYITKSKTEQAELMHSRSIVDLVEIAETPPNSSSHEDVEEGRREQALKFESLQAWSARLVVCTVDTVLGIMQNNRRGLFSFPALARGAFVFDEIHSYDAKLFGILCTFLQTFRGAPVLLMTASLPPRRLKRLKRSLRSDITEIPGPKTREGAPRYRLQLLEKSNAPDERPWLTMKALLEMRRNGKVLWIVNTVDRAIALYLLAKEHYQIRCFVYHSRFRYFERVDKHNAVVAAFDRTKDNEPALVIATQVAEMSLDLSSDLLISDIAPPASLIQRLGRLNRNEDKPCEIATAMILDVFESEGAWPYVGHQNRPLKEFLLARKWIEGFNNKAEGLSQADLTRGFEEVLTECDDEEFDSSSTWLSGSWDSRITSLREGDFSVPIVLERDVEVIRQKARESRLEMRTEAIRRSTTVPVNKRTRERVLSWQRLPEHKMFLIARDEDVDYSPDTGAKWRS